MPITYIARVALLSAITLATATAAFAVDDIIKPAPTPMPAAGPTVTAAQQFCGDPTGKAEELLQRYSTQKGLKEVYKSVDYVAYSDDSKNSTVMYTFTTKGHPAHPSAICRKLTKEGESSIIKMEVVCEGKDEPCIKLKNDFNVMLAKMQVEVNQQIEAQKK
jgi:hypothetical protein